MWFVNSVGTLVLKNFMLVIGWVISCMHICTRRRPLRYVAIVLQIVFDEASGL